MSGHSHTELAQNFVEMKKNEMPDSIRRNERNLACLACKETARKETGIKCRATTKKEPDASALGSRFSAVKNEQWHSLLWRLRKAHKGAELFDGPLYIRFWTRCSLNWKIPCGRCGTKRPLYREMWYENSLIPRDAVRKQMAYFVKRIQ